MTAFFQDLAEQVPAYVPGSFQACFPQPTRCGRPLKPQPIFLNCAQPKPVTEPGNQQHRAEHEEGACTVS